jgi:2'-5' RNA ligase
VGTDPLETGSRPEVEPRVRAFFGLPVPDAQRASLDGFVAACAHEAPGFRWTPAANLHLTVRFVGSVERALVEAIADRLGGRTMTGFDLELGEVGTFKRGRLVRVVWLGLRSGVEALTALAAQADAECVADGIVGEARAFQAHLTLGRARARYGAELPPLPPLPQLDPWRATELVLYASRLSRTGAVYEPLRVLNLD